MCPTGGASVSRELKVKDVAGKHGGALIQTRCPSDSARCSSEAIQLRMPFGSHCGSSESYSQTEKARG